MHIQLRIFSIKRQDVIVLKFFTESWSKAKIIRHQFFEIFVETCMGWRVSGKQVFLAVCHRENGYLYCDHGLKDSPKHSWCVDLGFNCLCDFPGMMS